VGADIGGTFTDIVLLGDDDIVAVKVLSTPSDYSHAVASGAAEAASRAGIRPAELEGVVHATTVVTNALLENKGVRTGLITTQGFRDVLEIGRVRRPSLYDLGWQKPEPLVPRSLRLEVEERMDAAGDVIRPLDEESARAAIRRLVDGGVEAVAVCLINSYVNARHERRIGELIAELAPGLHVSLSADILPQVREFERTSTTVVNATVAPVVERYVARLEARLTELGIGESSDESTLLLMQSNGGVVPGAVAARRPVALVESGPAAGALAAAVLARRRGTENLIGLDIGGTTAKAFLVEGGRLRESQQMEVGVGLNAESRLLTGGGYTIAVPSIDLAEVGAGGGSIAWIDHGGALKVGPKSAGADPGPACYGLGGTQPTVTDAFAVLGFFSEEGIAGGGQPIDVERARAAIAEHVAAPLGYSVEEAAWGIHLLNTATMIRAVRAVTTERGRDPRTMDILAFGGAGPAQAAEVLRQVGAERVIVPPLTGVFSSFGLLLADLRFDFQLPVMRPTEDLEDGQLASRFGELEATASEQLRALGIPDHGVGFEWGLDMRYAGQSSELAIETERGATLAAVQERFEAEHRSTYGYTRPQERVDVVTLRVRARTEGAHASYSRLMELVTRSRSAHPPGSSTTSAYFDDRRWETRVLAREDLAAGAVDGPLIVREYDSTIVVPPGCRATRDELFNVVIEPIGDA
jgi:N-methylhydantoinase A